MRPDRVSSLRLRRVLFTLFTLISAPGFAQAPAAANSTSKNVLRGTVVNSITGEPIRRALVQIFGNQHSALTDTNGQFEFDNLPDSETAVTIRKPGFFEEREVEDRESPSTMVKISADTQPIVLKLIPQGVIHGRVRDADGEPIENLPVSAWSIRIVDGRKRSQPGGSTQTNDLGEYRMANLRPGSYYISSGPSRASGRFAEQSTAYAASFFPDTSDLTSATQFEVRAGAQVEADFSLRSAPLFKVFGRVTGNATASRASIMFADHMGNNFTFLQRFDRTTGQFEAQLPAGSYILRAIEWEPDGKGLTAEVPLHVTSDTAGIALVLGAVHPSPVIVRVENTKPLIQGNRSTGAVAAGVRIHFFQSGDSVAPAEYWAEGQSGPNGRFVLPDLLPGNYSVEVLANEPWYVQSAQCGATDLLREDLIVTNGTLPPAIEVVVRNDSAELSGRVNFASSGPPPVIILAREHGPPLRTAAGQDGSFAVTSLAPDEYEVFAFNRTSSLEYANRDVLDRYTSKAAHVTLQPNGQEKITLDLINVN